MMKYAYILPLLELLNDDDDIDKDFRISHMDRKMLHFIQASFAVLLVETAVFYVNNHAKSTIFRTFLFCKSLEQLL